MLNNFLEDHDNNINDSKVENSESEVVENKTTENSESEVAKVKEAAVDNNEKKSLKEKKVLVNSTITKFEDPFLAQQRFKRTSMDNFEEKILSIRRVIKVTKGGRQFRFGALVVVGDKKGQVGYGTAKAKEVPDAIKKAIANAKKNLIYVDIDKNSKTVYHEWKGHKGATQVLLMPAGKGKGLIASETVRAVIELAGYQNIYSKVIGSNNKFNVVQATLNALENIKSNEKIAYLKSSEKSNAKFDNKRKPVIIRKKPQGGRFGKGKGNNRDGKKRDFSKKPFNKNNSNSNSNFRQDNNDSKSTNQGAKGE